METKKIVITNLFGIEELELDGQTSFLFGGKNGSGKSSILDSIKLALTNESSRDYIVREGMHEGSIVVEAGNVSIKRIFRTKQVNFKSIKQNGVEVKSPESFLSTLFSELQLDPSKFVQLPEREKNRMLLDMIKFDWNMDDIMEWFGEIPSWVSYDQPILNVLSDIASEKGQYFTDRTDINRRIRNDRDHVGEIAKSLPSGYMAEDWRLKETAPIYEQIFNIDTENEKIRKAKTTLENKDSKLRAIEADVKIKKAALSKSQESEKNRIDTEIAALTERLDGLRKEKGSLAESFRQKEQLIDANAQTEIAKLESSLKECEKYREAVEKETKDLREEAKTIENMKRYINEFDRMVSLQDTIKLNIKETERLTSLIEKARSLPGEILKKCEIPIEGLTVVDGKPLINGLPISNLSTGEQFNLCVQIAIKNESGLKIVLLDGIESLAKDMREKLFDTLRKNNIQFFATQTTEDDSLTITRL